MLVASYGNQPTANEREWGFPSTVGSIDCRYIELWSSVDVADKNWRLRHVYFHLMWHYDLEEDPKEIFAFHWEPSRLVAGAQGQQIQRPHVHLSVAPQPLARSHFVVTLAVAADDQCSVEYLDNLLDEAVKVVKTEVLDRLEARPLAWPRSTDASIK